MRMMEAPHFVENRGCGVKAISGVVREAEFEPPAFGDRRSSFLLTIRTYAWIGPEAEPRAVVSSSWEREKKSSRPVCLRIRATSWPERRGCSPRRSSFRES